MKTLLNDLFGMLVCSGVLYALYIALLDRRIPFRWCRIYLLAAAVVGPVLPLLRIPVWPGPVLTAGRAVTVGPLEGAVAEVIDDAAAGWPSVVAGIYLTGALLVLLPLLRQLWLLHRIARGAEITRTEEYRIVRTQQPVGACSLFRTIYLHSDLPAAELPLILLHERSHIRHRHSAERLAMELLKVVQWWNPFVWLLAGRLREVEEFEADDDVLRSGCDAQQYMQLMLKQLFGYSPDITNGLRNSLTKKRFLMMTTNRSHRHALWRMAGAAPALIGLLCAFSFTTRAAVYEVPETEATGLPLAAAPEVPATDTLHYTATLTYPADPQPAAAPAVKRDTTARSAALTVRSDDEPWLRSEVMPKFRGGDLLTFRQWAQEQVRYPKEALEQQIQGRVAVTFVIEKDGRLTSVQVLASPNPSLSDEVVRVLERSERWEPGRNAADEPVRVKYTLPIDFRLDAAPTAAAAASPGAVPAPGSEEPYVRTEQMPRYRGGDLQAFRQWVQLNVRYPQAAREQGAQGMVVATFVVEREGSVDAIEVLASPDPSLSDEVVRVLERSERWEPGRNAAGEPVRVKYTLPIYFGVDDGQAGERSTADPLTEARNEAEAIPAERGANIGLTTVIAYQ